jgi:dephospho-CoA kinase
MIVLGITGGIASGKTFVARELSDRGARILQADRVGHAVLRLPAVKQALHARWGGEVFASRDVRGRVDRAAVARRVFAPPPDGPRELAFLESVTHPLIGTQLAKHLRRWRSQGRIAVAVLDAPVLYKAGWERYCDHVVFVDAPLAVRAARAAQRGWSLSELQARQAAQPDLSLQRHRADAVIDNGGSPSETGRQLDALWRLWVACVDEVP